jgi:hypothetical protein
LNRGLDAYFPVGKGNAFNPSSLEIRDDRPLCIPASRLLRPYNPAELFLNSQKLRRVRSEMNAAAQTGKVYHLWWHPHNFGRYPQQSMEGLEIILENYENCRSKWGMSSLNMGEFASKLLNRQVDTAA